MSAVGVDVAVTTQSAAAASAGDFAALRMCESGGNYAINTGNGFYGAYQFDQQTWSGLGLAGRPDQASPATQDAAAARLQAARGWQPWPSCSRQLGLGSSSAPSPVAGPAAPARAVLAPAAPPAARPAAPRAVAAAPATPAAPAAPAAPRVPAAGAGLPLFTVALVDQVRPDVRAWQQAMVRRGYSLVVDGQYGPESAQATHEFEVQHGLQVETVGVVGPQVRAALTRAARHTG